MAAIIQLRRDTAANWTSVDPILASGEFGLEVDTEKFKVGDGITAWSSLSYWDAGATFNLIDDTTPQLGGNLDVNGFDIPGFSTDSEVALKAPLASPTFTGVVQFSKGADIASAATLVLGADGNYFDVTGTTTITSISTTGTVGTVIFLHFDSALTLTHSGSLVLPGSSNIITATGDEAIFIEFGSGVWRCINYSKFSGKSILTEIVDDTSPQLGGTLDTNNKLVQFSKGTDIASATALTLGTDGNYFDVTGTTTITSIGTTGKVGTVIKLHFDAALILTYHATDLILPGGANITTTAGDEAEFVEYATGDFRCTSYTKASGEAVVSSGGGLQSTQIFTTSGTWTKPAGINTIVVHVVGGGGGSGGCGAGTNSTGAGGAGGGYSRKLIDVSAISSETVTIGSGGTAGTSGAATSGGTGGTSSFGAHCSATGGNCGGNSTVGTGGNGSGGDINLYGGDGGIVGDSGKGGGAATGGASMFSGKALSPYNTDGKAGLSYGGGASGPISAGIAKAGGAGADGIVIVEEYA